MGLRRWYGQQQMVMRRSRGYFWSEATLTRIPVVSMGWHHCNGQLLMIRMWWWDCCWSGMTLTRTGGTKTEWRRYRCVEIVMIEKLDCVFYLWGPQGQYIWECKYGWMPSARTRVNSHLRPYETSPSPAIRDITVSGHTRHLRLRPRHLRLRLRPVYAIIDVACIFRADR